MSKGLRTALRVLSLIHAVSGCSSDPPAPAMTSTTLQSEDGFLYWVDPARCLDPCVGEPADLITVGGDARPTAAGELRLSARVQPRVAELFDAAALAGYPVVLDSGYRSYDEQLAIWNMLSDTEIGRAARPGHSEHQIGTAIDVAASNDGMQWLAEHAFEHGFALSFPRGAEKLTGVRYESWHFRYVGDAAAREIHDHGWSGAEYLRAHPELASFSDCGGCPNAQSRSPCDEAEPTGRCDGTVLHFCVDGASGAVDCAPVGSSCGADASGDVGCH